MILTSASAASSVVSSGTAAGGFSSAHASVATRRIVACHSVSQPRR